MPAAQNTVKNLKFCPTICCARKVSSLTKITDAIELSLSMPIVSLVTPGMIARIACGKDDAAQGQKSAHAERRRGYRLVAAYRDDAAANNFGAECCLIQRKTDDRSRKAVEFEPNQRQRVIDEHQLQQLRRAPDDPDIGPRRRAQRRHR